MIANLTIHQKDYLQMACVTLLAVNTLATPYAALISTLPEKLIWHGRLAWPTFLTASRHSTPGDVASRLPVGPLVLR